MKSLQQLTLSLLVVISLLSFSPYAMPRWGPILDEPNGLSEQASDPDNYVVFAKNSTDKDQTTAIGKLLESVVSDPKNISVHGSSHVGVSFWAVPLTAEDAEKVRADPNVGAVVRPCTENCPDPTDSDEPNAGDTNTKRSSGSIVHEGTSLVKRDDGLVNSHKIDPEMVFISLPDEAKLDDYEDFVYDKSAGTNVMVYIVDTGADLRNDDEFSTHVRANVRWLHAFGAFPQDTTENDIKGRGHGIGILAKAAGWKHGIAKRSNPVVVRVNNLGDPAAWLDGVIKAYDDWMTNHYIGHEKTATGILNLSWGWTRDGLIKTGYDTEQQIFWVTELRRFLRLCVAAGLLPITPSGNSPHFGPPNVAVDEYPQLFAYGNPADVPDMMVVGGIGTNGDLWRRSKVDPPNQGNVIKVYAPCYDITVPDAITGGYRAPATVDGVSYASGTIAGLGAYFLGLSSLADSLHDDDPTKRVRKLKEELQVGSCIKRVNGFCALHNLVDPRKCPPDVPPDFRDGDEVGCKAEETATPTEDICIVPYNARADNRAAATCTTRNDEGFPAETPLPDGTFACTNFCFCGAYGKSLGCETPKANEKREEHLIPNGAPKPTPAPVLLS